MSKADIYGNLTGSIANFRIAAPRAYWWLRFRLRFRRIVLGFAPDAVLLDNMSLDHLRRAVAIVGGRAIIEASGRITSDTARAIAATGVDLIPSAD